MRMAGSFRVPSLLDVALTFGHINIRRRWCYAGFILQHEMVVPALHFEQFLVSALFNHFAFVDENYSVCIEDCS